MAIKTLTLPDGRIVTIDECLHWPIYSTGEVEGGVAPLGVLGLGSSAKINLQLFGYVVGDRVPVNGTIVARNATVTDTNQVAKTRMNHDEAMLVFSHFPEFHALDSGTEMPTVPNTVQAAVPAMTGTNIRRLQKDVYVELIIGAGITKPQARAPLAYFGGGVGAPAYGSGDALVGGPGTIAFNYGTPGCPVPRAERGWNLPVHITSSRIMKLRLRSQAPVDGVDQSFRIRWWLDGIKRRPVA